MSSNLESYHYKIGVKADCIGKIIDWLRYVNDTNDLMQLACHVERLLIEYTDATSAILAKYYSTNDVNLMSQSEEIYCKTIVSNNFVDRLDTEFTSVEKIRLLYTSLYHNKFAELVDPVFVGSDKIEKALETDLDKLAFDLQEFLTNGQKTTTTTKTNKKPLNIVLDSLFKTYKDQIIQISIKRIPIETCNVCGNNMTLFADRSEMRCSSSDCGQIVTLYGIVFEDNQIYNQQNTAAKNKKYDPNGHLSKWIDKIQSKEDYIFDPNVITAVDEVAIKEYTRNGQLRNMTNLRCETIREWLKRLGFNNCYDHAPLLRKIITGIHGTAVVPPEFTAEERQDILIECSLSLREYETVIKNQDLLRRLEKDRAKNKFYYPYVLWQIINLKITDPTKKRKLLECIHLQSEKTLRNNDLVWHEICKKRGYQYYSANNNL